MYCLRCGREKPENQVFCDICLNEMARHPVKPDATVYIPNHKDECSVKKRTRRKKKKLPPEKLVPILKKRIKWLWAVVLILSLLLGACGFGIYLAWNHNPGLQIGQNYQTVETPDTVEKRRSFNSSGG